MAINEVIITGRKYRRLIDVATKLWERISFWTKASDVEFDDGKNAQLKVGAIKGITTSTSVTETGYAIDASVIPSIYAKITELNNNFNDAIADAYQQGMNAVNNANIGSITQVRNGGSVGRNWICNSKLAIVTVNAHANCGNTTLENESTGGEGRCYVRVGVDGITKLNSSVWVHTDGSHDDLSVFGSFSMTKGQKLQAWADDGDSHGVWASLDSFSGTVWLLD